MTMMDLWEYDNGLDFTNAEDALLDLDGDGLTNLEEFTAKTSANNADTDDDGLSDFDEITNTKTDPLDEDTDNDRMPDGWELS
jgi:pseudolysin